MRTLRNRFTRTLVAATVIHLLPAGTLLASPSIDALQRAPLAFVANDGQLPEAVLFNARTPQADVFLTRDGAVLSLQGKDRHATLRISLVGSHVSEALVGKEPLAGKINMFHGSDPAGWRTNIPTYGRVLAPGVMPGVDAVYYGNGRSLEFDFVVAPGVDAGALRLRLDGADRLAVDAAGNLQVQIAGGSVELQAPVVYQDGAAGRTPVEGRYVVKGKDEVAFELCGRDPARTVVIDPVITYSTYHGGAAADWLMGIAAGPGGSFYVAGQTASNPFPGTSGNPVGGMYGGGANDCFVTKFNADGTLAWSAYLGGSLGDSGYDVAVDADGNAYVSGFTNSPNFPTTPNAFQPALNGTVNDAFLAELSPDGSQLLYSTYFGGSARDEFPHVRLYSPGDGEPLRVYVCGRGQSTDLPTTENAYDRSANGNWDAFLAIFTPSVVAPASALFYSTHFGGLAWDDPKGLAVDRDGSIWLAGPAPTSGARRV